jgi:hypothetical protein
MNKNFIFLVLFSSALYADSYVTCKSEGYRYQVCPIQDHGYVRISNKLSKAACIQGKTWDYDKRSVWVDDGCAAEFIVEGRSHSKNHKNKNVAVAVLGLALLASANKHDHKDDHYNDNNYHRGGHTSHVPGWMIGYFVGYNMTFGSDVSLDISEDGRVKANVSGNRVTGYVNDGRLYIGDAEFYLDKSSHGLNTTQVGDNSNVVHYNRR